VDHGPPNPRPPQLRWSACRLCDPCMGRLSVVPGGGGRGLSGGLTCVAPHGTGAGGDNGIDHDKNWLRFPYVSIVLRSHDLHPEPYHRHAGGVGHRHDAVDTQLRRRGGRAADSGRPHCHDHVLPVGGATVAAAGTKHPRPSQSSSHSDRPARVAGSLGGGGGGGESFMCVYWVAVPKAMRARRANRRRRRRRRAIGSRRSPRARSCCAAAAEGPNSSCLQPSARGLPPPAARGAISGGDRWAQVGVMIGSPCLGLCTHCDPMASLKTVMLPWS
jgi:hypothetical protein